MTMPKNYSTEFRRYFLNEERLERDIIENDTLNPEQFLSIEQRLNYLSFLRRINREYMNLAAYLSKDPDHDDKFLNHEDFDAMLARAIQKVLEKYES